MTAPSRAEIVELVDAATRAPSSHNTQPWRFRVDAEQITVLADYTRALPVADPHGRELTISCGAALFSLVVAARRAGLAADVDRQPAEAVDDTIATVSLSPAAGADTDDHLYDAIPARHTVRGPMRADAVGAALVETMASRAGDDGASLVVVEPGRRAPIAELIAEGDRLQFADRWWRAELASWMRSGRRGDGLPVPTAIAPLSRLVVANFDLGARTAAKDHSLACSAPVLAVLVTADDDPVDWVRAGEALQHLLLQAASQGVQAGFLNQPCQVDELRPRLADLVGGDGFPQMVLRLGYPAEPPRAAPRRPLQDVLEDA